jgi:hypothetical protein
MNRLLAGGMGDEFPAGARDFFLLRNVQTSSGVHPIPYSMGTGFFPPRR